MVVPSTDIRARTVQKSASWILVIEKDGAGSVELEFEAVYEPKYAGIGPNLACWSANELAIVEGESLRTHRVRCREFIQSALLLDETRLCVVCDTYVSVITLGEWRERIVLDNDEIFVTAVWNGSILTLTDIQGKVSTVPLFFASGV